MTRSRLFAPLLFALCGGCAIRGTVHLAKAEQAILRLEPVEAETWAPYSSTMARQVPSSAPFFVTLYAKMLLLSESTMTSDGVCPCLSASTSTFSFSSVDPRGMLRKT